MRPVGSGSARSKVFIPPAATLAVSTTPRGPVLSVGASLGQPSFPRPQRAYIPPVESTIPAATAPYVDRSRSNSVQPGISSGTSQRVEASTRAPVVQRVSSGTGGASRDAWNPSSVAASASQPFSVHQHDAPLGGTASIAVQAPIAAWQPQTNFGCTVPSAVTAAAFYESSAAAAVDLRKIPGAEMSAAASDIKRLQEHEAQLNSKIEELSECLALAKFEAGLDLGKMREESDKAVYKLQSHLDYMVQYSVRDPFSF
jgi:hypothetical protein